MAAMYKTAYALPRSTMSSSTLPAFKRKRIEQWCDEVAKHIMAGSLCQVVMDDLPFYQDNAADPTSPSTDHTTASRGANELQLPSSGNDTSQPTTRESSLNTVLGRPAHAPEVCSWSLGSRTPVYSHYHEQRRKVERLVQGLPVHSTARSARMPPASRTPLISASAEVVRLAEVSPLESCHQQQGRSTFETQASRPLTKGRPRFSGLQRSSSDNSNCFWSRSRSPAAIASRPRASLASRYGLRSSADVVVIEDNARCTHSSNFRGSGKFLTGTCDAVNKSRPGHVGHRQLSANNRGQMMTLQVHP